MVQFGVKRAGRLINLTMRQVPILPNMLIVAISRNGKIIIIRGDTIVEDQTTVYLIDEKTGITELHNPRLRARQMHQSAKSHESPAALEAGFYLAKRLSEFGIAVKIIEKDKGSLLLSPHIWMMSWCCMATRPINLCWRENLPRKKRFHRCDRSG